MRYKKILLLLFFLSLTVYMNTFSQSKDSVYSEPLKGIRRLKVLIETLNEEAKKMGLSEERLRTVVELKIRREGIEISPAHLYAPYIYLNVIVIGNAFNIVIQIKELVKLERDPFINCLAVTWIEGVTGHHGNDSEYIVSRVSSHVDTFLNHWYIANPRGAVGRGLSRGVWQVKVLRIEKRYTEFRVLVEDSEMIIVLARVDAKNITWLKEGMDVKMLYYFNNEEIWLEGPDGNSNKFKRVK